MRKNFALILAFALPIALILIVAISVYVPSIFLKTDYNFVYATCEDGVNKYSYSYNCGNYLNSLYSVEEGKLIKNIVNPSQDSDRDSVPDIEENYTIRIFLHDTGKNESREITMSEAQTLTLNSLLTSPDGVSVTHDYNRGANFLFFDGGSDYGYYLMKGNRKQKLNLVIGDDRYYYRDDRFGFIGWVLPPRQ